MTAAEAKALTNATANRIEIDTATASVLLDVERTARNGLSSVHISDPELLFAHGLLTNPKLLRDVAAELRKLDYRVEIIEGRSLKIDWS
jgi:hypothetical protein